MGAEEPLSTREILGKFEEVRRGQEAADSRIAKVAAETVTTEVWSRENGHIQRDIAEVDAHCEERHNITMRALTDVKSAMAEMKRSSDTALGDLKKSIEKRSDLTWQRALGILGILAMLAAAWYTALHTGGH
jgi:hypothetical protein